MVRGFNSLWKPPGSEALVSKRFLDEGVDPPDSPLLKGLDVIVLHDLFHTTFEAITYPYCMPVKFLQRLSLSHPQEGMVYCRTVFDDRPQIAAVETVEVPAFECSPSEVVQQPNFLSEFGPDRFNMGALTRRRAESKANQLEGPGGGNDRIRTRPQPGTGVAVVVRADD